MAKLHLVQSVGEPVETDMSKEGLLLYKMIEAMAERIAEIEIDMLHVMADIGDKDEI